MIKLIDLLREINEIITCQNCGWSWNLKDGGDDPHLCHKCGCNNSLEEAKYQGRTVTLNKPMQGDSKKFKVYVKNDKGKVVKVNFGAKGMNIKKNNPVRRKAFRARMGCDNPGPKWKSRFWSCKAW